ncbi:MAG: FHA domain-containing protein [Lautropia sp.]
MQHRETRHGEGATVGKLVLSAANRILREVLIDRRRLTIGRRPYNDLLLDDLTVSGEHAIVHTANGESVIHDLKSRNGTLINGAPVMQQQLADGDCVDIGIYRLVYKVERIETRQPPLFRPGLLARPNGGPSTNLAGARTSAWVPNGADGGGPNGGHGGNALDGEGHGNGHGGSPGGGPGGGPGGSLGGGQGNGGPGGSLGGSGSAGAGAAFAGGIVRPVRLRYLGGFDAGREVVLERPIVSIRNGSGQVAVVARRKNGYFLTHVEGAAYPLVNGESIGLGAHVLTENDLIELAGTIIQFCVDP